MIGRGRRLAGVLVCVLALTACNDWSQPLFDSGRSASNPAETAITPANVATLTQHVIPKLHDNPFTIPVLTMGRLVLTAPVIARTDAFSAKDCPRSDDGACTPLWEYSGRLLSADADAVYVGHGSPSYTFEAIDTKGVRVHRYDGNVPAGFGITTVVPVGDHLIADVFTPGASPTSSADIETLYVFPRTCAQLTCTPVATLPMFSKYGSGYLWSASNSVLYSAGPDAGGRLTARNLLTGATLWTTAEGDVQLADYRLAGGRVYTSAGYVYDAAGVQGCSGAPKVCAPIRRLADFFPIQSLSGPRTLGGYSPQGNPVALGFWSTDGSDCSGSPQVCTVHARTAAPVGGTVSTGSLAFAIHAGSGLSPHDHLQAYDLANTTGCSGTPLVCAPVADFDLGASGAGNIAVAGGRVYVPMVGGAVHVFSLPGDVG